MICKRAPRTPLPSAVYYQGHGKVDGGKMAVSEFTCERCWWVRVSGGDLVKQKSVFRFGPLNGHRVDWSATHGSDRLGLNTANNLETPLLGGLIFNLVNNEYQSFYKLILLPLGCRTVTYRNKVCRFIACSCASGEAWEHFKGNLGNKYP